MAFLLARALQMSYKARLCSKAFFFKLILLTGILAICYFFIFLNRSKPQITQLTPPKPPGASTPPSWSNPWSTSQETSSSSKREERKKSSQTTKPCRPWTKIKANSSSRSARSTPIMTPSLTPMISRSTSISAPLTSLLWPLFSRLSCMLTGRWGSWLMTISSSVSIRASGRRLWLGIYLWSRRGLSTRSKRINFRPFFIFLRVFGGFARSCLHGMKELVGGSLGSWWIFIDFLLAFRLLTLTTKPFLISFLPRIWP